MSLQADAKKGLLWTAAERFTQQGAGFVVQLVLARLLLPEHFGLIAMVAVFVALARGIADAGLHEALIQKESIDDELTSTVFYVNLLISAVLACVLWFGAEWIAGFYAEEKVIPLLRLLCIAVLLDGFSRIQQTLLQRELQFKKLSLSLAGSSVASGVIAIGLALAELGVWALVWQIIIQRLLAFAFLWSLSSWRPGFLCSPRRCKEILPFAGRMYAANLLNQIFHHVYVLVIARIANPAQLGYYQRADSFKRLSSSTSSMLMNRITFPLFAKVQGDPARLRRGFEKSIKLLTFAFLPCMAVLAGVGEPLIVFLIGEKWLPCVPYLRLLCLVGALHPIHAINVNVLKALGRGELFLRLEVIKKVVVIALLCVTVRHGVYVMVIGQVCASLIALLINAHYTGQLLQVGFVRQLSFYAPSVVIAVIVFAAVWSSIELMFGVVLPLQLICGLLIAGLTWAACIAVLRRLVFVELEWIISLGLLRKLKITA